mmetsp:Transcript_636/g.1560  ORF Transcript_636/g.1560 Transcript_636/m.1560 type:complete len:203 (-) Transcript_636:1520-2128(-)
MVPVVLCRSRPMPAMSRAVVTVTIAAACPAPATRCVRSTMRIVGALRFRLRLRARRCSLAALLALLLFLFLVILVQLPVLLPGKPVPAAEFPTRVLLGPYVSSGLLLLRHHPLEAEPFLNFTVLFLPLYQFFLLLRIHALLRHRPPKPTLLSNLSLSRGPLRVRATHLRTPRLLVKVGIGGHQQLSRSHVLLPLHRQILLRR